VLKGWVKNDSTTGAVSLGIRFINDAGSSIRYMWKEADRSSDWTSYEMSFLTPPNTEKIAVYFDQDQAVNGSAWIDDVYVKEVE